MRQVLIFAGTTEGRELAVILSKNKIRATVCVATDYGMESMPQLDGITVREGRMDQNEMCDCMRQLQPAAVVDATHPFATEVSANIRACTDSCALPYLRLKRDTGAKGQTSEKQKYFADFASCLSYLETISGRILLTTGSKELALCAGKDALKEHIVVRVLPGEESLMLCKKAGLKNSQIIAMQGPFSTEMNLALIHQYKISCLVTKESGATGGFAEKKEAAERAGIEFCVIANPEKGDGMTMAEICRRLEQLTGQPVSCEASLELSLIGTGMGNPAGMTKEACEKIGQADLILGAKRLVEAFPDKKQIACYRFCDMEPHLFKLRQDNPGKTVHAALLFSGDTGFYSGASSVYREICAWEEGKKGISVAVYPGISSVSYFAAKLGTSWEDAALYSIHGRGTRADWEAELASCIRRHKKTFLLLSGAADVRILGEILSAAGLLDCPVMAGYRLSYPDEEILTLTAQTCTQVQKEGLYVCLICNPTPQRVMLAPNLRDEAFFREQVPMTKEEIRHLIVCALQPQEGDIIYDIGSGTGSVAMELALRSATLRIYAIEHKEAAAALIEKNRAHFHAANVQVIRGSAPKACEPLPVPDKVFIGGSSGTLTGLLQMLQQKQRREPKEIRVVMTAVTLETAAQMTDLLKREEFQDIRFSQIQVTRTRQAGRYHLMQAENPVFFLQFVMQPQRGREENRGDMS